MRAPRTVLLATALSACVVVGIAPSASAASDTRQRKVAVDRQLVDMGEALESSTAALQQAGEQLQAVSRALPAAERARAEAQARLETARAADAEAEQAARAAQRRADAARRSLEAARDEVDAARVEVDRFARAAYQGGSLLSVGAILEAGSPADLAARMDMVRSVARDNDQALNSLVISKMRVRLRSGELDREQAAADAARERAAAALVTSVSAQQRAADAEAQLQQLQRQRSAALRTAQAERRADELRYRGLQAQSQRLGALLRAEAARARQEAAHRLAVVRAARAARAALARAAAQRAAAQRALAQRATAARQAAVRRAAAREAAARAAAAAAARRSRTTPRPSPDRRPNSALLWPSPGPMNSGFGMRFHPIYHEWRLHAGIDIASGYGAPIYAAEDGVVIRAGFVSGYGNQTAIFHGFRNGRGLSTTYNHQSVTFVRPGQHVRRGQLIGRVGATGNVTGPHLHFEVRLDGVPVDPMNWL